jgi:membrane protein
MKKGIGFWFLVLGDAIAKFNRDDGWAVASHVALSGLFALFPFLIFATSIAGFFHLGNFADNAIEFIFGYWPPAASEAIAREVRTILTVPRGDFLTIGGLLTLYFASNGVEAIRVALNRSYRQVEKRPFWRLRMQSIAFVFVGIIVLMVITLLLVLLPLLWGIAARYLPLIVPWSDAIHAWRVIIAVLVLTVSLVLAHKYLPAGNRSIMSVLPGIVFTLGSWLVASIAFGAYLEQFADYVSTYAGLAGAMIALLFLYMLAAIFIFGGHINASFERYEPIY